MTGVDLVAWMLRLAGGDASMMDGLCRTAAGDHRPRRRGRVYAEDPGRDYRPSAGDAHVGCSFPPPARVETWVDTGTG